MLWAGRPPLPPEGRPSIGGTICGSPPPPPTGGTIGGRSPLPFRRLTANRYASYWNAYFLAWAKMRKIICCISSKLILYGLKILYSRRELWLSHQSDSSLLDVFNSKKMLLTSLALLVFINCRSNALFVLSGTKFSCFIHLGIFNSPAANVSQLKDLKVKFYII